MRLLAAPQAGLRAPLRQPAARDVHRRAQPSTEEVSREDKPSTSEEDDFRFKYDFANSRWIRVKKDFKLQGEKQGDKYTEDRWKEAGATMITPKTGSPYLVWPVMHMELTRRKLQSVPPEEALRLQREEGAVLLDVRPEYQFKAERAAGARHLPLFRIVQGTAFWDRVKSAVMASLFMAATERDPDFGKNAAAQLDKGKPIVVYCGRGGTLETGARFGKKEFKDDPEKMFGIESRSLKGCYELQEAGFTKVLHLKGGLSQWRYDGHPVEKA